MNLVVDANILFAALIKNSITAELLVDENFHFFAPEFIIEEFYRHKDEILGKTSRTAEEFDEIYEIIMSLITMIPAEEVKLFLKEAKRISPDEKDIPYFAASLKLNCAIWSNDEKLKDQDMIKVYSTADLLKYLS